MIQSQTEKLKEKNCCVYILECGDGSLYTGWTNHLENRVKAHRAGRGAKYTKAHQPVRLVYSEAFDTKLLAMKREYALKQLTRGEKLALIAGSAKQEKP